MADDNNVVPFKSTNKTQKPNSKQNQKGKRVLTSIDVDALLKEYDTALKSDKLNRGHKVEGAILIWRTPDNTIRFLVEGWEEIELLSTLTGLSSFILEQISGNTDDADK